MKIIIVAGARPNFVKIAPLMRAFKNRADVVLVHTGQHYDKNMSDVFFQDLAIPNPDVYLEVRSDSPVRQVAKIILEFEKVCLKENPDLIIVVGDVNSTLAAALVGAKLGIKIAHIEAGLRSFDRTMPEEINRILVDQVADYLFTTEENANQNLAKQGIDKNKIFFTGNIMIDTLVSNLDRINKLGRQRKGDYCVLTIHRSSNVDDKQKLEKLLLIISDIAKKIKVVFPMHPRTKQVIGKFGLTRYLDGIDVIEPQSYLHFLNLIKNAKFVLTDSGGIQEETTFLGIPCLTLRKTTERPITVELGTNILLGDNQEKIKSTIAEIIAGTFKKGTIPSLWDGKAAQRIINILLESK